MITILKQLADAYVRGFSSIVHPWGLDHQA
jgi:hypothetical protein